MESLRFPNSCEIESLVGHSRVTPSLKIELDLPDRSGVVENGRVIITLKRKSLARGRRW